MRRLNESASWLSDVSGVSDDDEGAETADTAATALDVRSRLLCRDMLNESATFLDESDSSEPECELVDAPQEQQPTPVQPRAAAIAERAGFLEEGYGYGPSPMVVAGVARSFSW